VRSPGEQEAIPIVRRGKLLAVLGVALVLAGPVVPVGAEAGGLHSAISRGAAKGTARAATKASTRVLRHDLVRDRATLARPLARERSVFRYTTADKARRELRAGIAPGTHMTSRAVRGRPLVAGKAQSRYGLQSRPDVRETVRLPGRQPVRINRAVGGAPGVGEITSPKRVPARAIERVVPLKPGR